MKTKKSYNKLPFSKTTIADLNVKELNEIQGGGTTPFVTRFETCTQTCQWTCLITCLHAPGSACLVPH